MRESLFLAKNVWIYNTPIDFRKQTNGLVQTVVESEGVPADGSVYVFQNRQKNKLKLLTWHVNGFFLGYKRLERGRFDFPVEGEIVQVSRRELMNLLCGMPMIYVGKEGRSSTIFS